MSTRQKSEEIADRLHSAALHLLRWLRREDTASGLSAAQLSALSVIVFSEAPTAGELASAEQVSAATISRLIDLLERRGLVVRATDEADRRVVRLHSTAAGDAVLHEGRRRRIQALMVRLEALSREQLRTLEEAVRILEELVGGGVQTETARRS
jgi:DNA-binding MarR family transcriptional regulator